MGSGRYGDPATADLGDFNPFNLIVADSEQAYFLSNRPEHIRTALPHGIYGLSNGALDEPWPKTLQLKSALTDWLIADTANVDELAKTGIVDRKARGGLDQIVDAADLLAINPRPGIGGDGDDPA